MQKTHHIFLVTIAVLSTFSCGWKRPLKPVANVTEAAQVAGGVSGIILGNQEGKHYIEVFSHHIKSIGIESVFFYDITRDDVPEFWMITDDCEAERMVLVYSLSDWGKELFRDSADHSVFYAGKDYVLRLCAHMGYADWHQLRWNGKMMVSNKVFEERTNGDYKTPIEKPVDAILPEDLNPDELLKRDD